MPLSLLIDGAAALLFSGLHRSDGGRNCLYVLKSRLI